ncbi:MAG: lipid-A-disaccharide synthase [Candidatus Cloacimonetes bacterium]|nr:lipid-A-disaccharide synthase [Candidatus Cloacimonadota bacterium]
MKTNNKSIKRVFWIAGENSADLHSSIILRELNNENINIKNFGIGGKKMTAEGFRAIFPFERFSVMGFIEIVKHITFFLNVEKRIKKIFKHNPPDLVVLVDYPGLNMRIAKIAKNLQIPVLYYIVPQFWAWKYKRIFKLQKYADHIAYILPFEGEHFKKHKITASFTGHPISEEIIIQCSKAEFAAKYNLDIKKKWLGFLPGSREAEITNMLPNFIKAIELFDPAKYEFLISKASSVSSNLLECYANKTKNQVHIIEDMNYDLMKHCDLLTITSGTATVEAAYIGTPFIIVYKTSKISYQIGKKFVRIDQIGLPNLILNKHVVPELIQNDVNEIIIHQELNNLLSTSTNYDKMKAELKLIHNVLGSKKPSVIVSKIIRKFINE